MWYHICGTMGQSFRFPCLVLCLVVCSVRSDKPFVNNDNNNNIVCPVPRSSMYIPVISSSSSKGVPVIYPYINTLYCVYKGVFTRVFTAQSKS